MRTEHVDGVWANNSRAGLGLGLRLGLFALHGSIVKINQSVLCCFLEFLFAVLLLCCRRRRREEAAVWQVLQGRVASGASGCQQRQLVVA